MDISPKKKTAFKDSILLEELSQNINMEEPTLLSPVAVEALKSERKGSRVSVLKMFDPLLNNSHNESGSIQNVSLDKNTLPEINISSDVPKENINTINCDIADDLQTYDDQNKFEMYRSTDNPQIILNSDELNLEREDNKNGVNEDTNILLDTTLIISDHNESNLECENDKDQLNKDPKTDLDVTEVSNSNPLNLEYVDNKSEAEYDLKTQTDADTAQIISALNELNLGHTSNETEVTEDFKMHFDSDATSEVISDCGELDLKQDVGFGTNEPLNTDATTHDFICNELYSEYKAEDEANIESKQFDNLDVTTQLESACSELYITCIENKGEEVEESEAQLNISTVHQDIGECKEENLKHANIENEEDSSTHADVKKTPVSSNSSEIKIIQCDVSEDTITDLDDLTLVCNNKSSLNIQLSDCHLSPEVKTDKLCEISYSETEKDIINNSEDKISNDNSTDDKFLKESQEKDLLLKEYLNKIADLEMALAEKNNIITSQEGQIEENELKVKELEKQVSNEIVKSTTLETKNEELTQKIVEFNRVLRNYDNQMPEFTEKYTQLNENFKMVSHSLATTEVAFHDVIQKYERSKKIIEGYAANEAIFKHNIEQLEQRVTSEVERYLSLKKHSQQKIQEANEDINRLKESSECALKKQDAIVKRLEIKVASLEVSLQQKTKELNDLSSLYDKVTGKM